MSVPLLWHYICIRAELLENFQFRWEQYFEHLLNEENQRVVVGDGIPNQGLTSDINREEVKRGLRKVKDGRVTNPDNIPVEIWRRLGEESSEMLWDLMRKIYRQEKMPKEWRESSIIPIYQEKGDIQDCGNYRGIKLLSQAMKLWERIIEARVRWKHR